MYHLHAPRLMVVYLRYAPNSAEAQDILQESFIKIYEKLNT
ncbi:MAG: sigma factor, partial [Spirosomataceae bacterium]